MYNHDNQDQTLDKNDKPCKPHINTYVKTLPQIF